MVGPREHQVHLPIQFAKEPLFLATALGVGSSAAADVGSLAHQAAPISENTNLGGHFAGTETATYMGEASGPAGIDSQVDVAAASKNRTFRTNFAGTGAVSYMGQADGPTGSNGQLAERPVVAGERGSDTTASRTGSADQNT